MKFIIIGTAILIQLKTVGLVELKDEAFTVLHSKCNVCHSSKNPSKIFTIENMDQQASIINRQVFLWKRMPKGNEIKLTEEDKLRLKNWINSLKS